MKRDLRHAALQEWVLREVFHNELLDVGDENIVHFAEEYLGGLLPCRYDRADVLLRDDERNVFGKLASARSETNVPSV